MQHHQQEPTQHQTKNTFTNLGRNFQEKVMQALIVDRIWAASFVEVFEVDTCFEYAELKLLANRYINHYNQYKEFPSLDLLISVVKEDFKTNTDVLLRERMITFLKRVAGNKDLGDLGWVKDKAFSFCRQQQVKKALLESAEISEDEDQYDLIVSKMKKAISSGIAMSDGLDYANDIDVRYSETYRRCISTGIKELDERKMLNGGLGGGEIGVVVAPTGCHAKGTELLMFDGSTKVVEDIILGDRLMGPDSSPRTVLNLVRGKDEMFKVSPTKGDSFVVNGEHILSLVNTETDKICDISLNDWLKSNKTFKHVSKLYRSEVLDFPSAKEELPLDPYVLGLILGDGCLLNDRVELTSADDVLADVFKEFAKTHGMGVTTHSHKGCKTCFGYYLTSGGKHNHPVRSKLKNLGLMGKDSSNKSIPVGYKTASKKERLEVLAGLLDTDGSVANNCFDYISKSKQLASDVSFIARSLGLAAYITPCKKGCQTGTVGTYYRVCISGDTYTIPCRLARKQCTPRLQKKNVLRTGFKAETVGVDNYYGFTVDQNNLYLGADFTVFHNCGKSHVLVALGSNAVLTGKNVLHYTLELNERMLGIRYDSNLVNISSTDCIDNQVKIKNYFIDNVDKLGKLRIKHLPAKSTTVNTLRAHIEKLKMKDFAPDLILVDYAGIMRSTSKYDLLRMELKEVIQELRDLAEEMDIPVWTALQSNKAGASSDIVDLTNMAESYGQAHIADVVLGLSRKSENKATGLGHLFVAKNRAGMDGILYPIHMDTARSKIRVLSGSEAQDFEAEVEQRIDETTTKTNMIAAKNFQKVMNENKSLFQRT